MLLNGLSAAPRSKTLKEAANESYAKCLKPYHGFFASSAFSVVLQFPPTREVFVESLGQGRLLLTRHSRRIVLYCIQAP